MDKLLLYPKDAQKLLKRYQIEEEARCDAENPIDHEAPFSNVFFDFANTTRVGYSTPNKDVLLFEQDETACGQHTGGIIWETSYVLLNYLLTQKHTSNHFLGDVIELGAGVGFLGQCLAAEGCCHTVIVSETNDVLINLRRTLKANQDFLKNKSVEACLLDWRKCEEHVPRLRLQSFDTILATDVLFAPELVEPLLKAASLLSNKNTVWFLCVQKRCSKSHDDFLTRAPGFGFIVEDLSDSLDEWGKAVECVLLRLTRRSESFKTERPANKRVLIA